MCSTSSTEINGVTSCFSKFNSILVNAHYSEKHLFKQTTEHVACVPTFLAVWETERKQCPCLSLASGERSISPLTRG